MKEAAAIVQAIQVTEKSTGLKDKQRKYFFRVACDANKIEIKRAVETLYGVSVVGVNTMNYDGKKKRMRTTRYGRRSDWKRAVVTLKEGSEISLTA
jgi:large subunit ribosomal protein L23